MTVNLERRKNRLTTRRHLVIEPLEHRRVLAVFTVTSLADSGSGSLRQATQDANDTLGADEIIFDGSLSGAIELTSGELEFTEGVEINGPGAGVITIDALGMSRAVFFNSAGSDFALRGVTITGGSSATSGGALLATGYTVIANAILTGNSAADSGGAVSGPSAPTVLEITNTTISNNQSQLRGGGIAAGVLNVTGSHIADNTASNGGGIYGRLVEISDSTISGNSASLGGGGVLAGFGGSVEIENSAISDNTSSGTGGGVYGAGFVTIRSSVLTGNSASFGGGAMATSQYAYVEIDQATISGNTAGFGGGIFAYFYYATGYSTVFSISNSTISGNEAQQGGAMYVGYYSMFDGFVEFTIENSTLSGNTATAVGGGAFLSVGFASRVDVQFRNSTITENSAGSGGGLYVSQDSAVFLANSIISGNSVTQVGPDIYDFFPTGDVSLHYSFLGMVDGTDYFFTFGVPDANGNFTQDLLLPALALGPLANNGGPTYTHALMPDSPVINVGDPSFSDLDFDQRGAPFVRIYDGRLDMGAYEAQPTTVPDGDFNDDTFYDCFDIDALTTEIAAMTNSPLFDLTLDGSVDVDDLNAWLVEGGANNPNDTGGNPFLPADADLDGLVGASDFAIWKDNRFTPNTEWCSGNFNADSVIDGQDLLIWNAYKFQSSNPVPGTRPSRKPVSGGTGRLNDSSAQPLSPDRQIELNYVAVATLPFSQSFVSEWYPERERDDNRDEQSRMDLQPVWL